MGGPNFLGAGPLLIDSASASYFLNGYVGIGTASPGEKLTISHNQDNPLGLWRSSTGAWNYINFGEGGNRYYALGIDPSGNFRIYKDASGSNVVLAAEGGNVGIGTATPGAKLEVNGPVKLPEIGLGMGTNGTAANNRISQTLANGALALSANGSGVLFLNFDGGSALEVRNNQGTARMSVDANGHVTIAGALSPVYGRSKVGIASNGFDYLIFNYGDADSGVAYWFKNPNSGRDQGTSGSQKMKLDSDGSLWLGTTPRKVIDSGGYALYG